MADTKTQPRVWHASLQTRVTALVVAVVTCIVVGKSAFDLYSNATEREAAMAYHLQMVTDMQAKTIAENPPANGSAPAETAPNVWSLEALSVHQEGARRDTVGTLRVTFSRRALDEAWWHQVILGLETTTVVSLVTLAAVLASLRMLMQPLRGLTAAMERLATGDTSVAVNATDRRDEIGAMARAVDVFRSNKMDADQLQAEQAAAREARSRRQDAMERDTAAFGTSVSNVMTKLAGAAEDMRLAAEVMTQAAATVHQAATSTSGGAVESADDLATTAVSVQDLTASFAEIARQVTTAADVARKAVQRAEANQLTIRGLAESTARIGDVVKLIDSIAAQTNLLALNATIEAARAGDAGKGFAVVASEVKALATQTARATAEIASQIDSVRSVTEATVEAMHEIGALIGRMDEVASAIATSVERQSETTQAISARVKTVSDATALSAQSMGRVVEVAGEAGTVSQKVLNGAGDIRQEATLLRDEVERFLALLQIDSGERRRFERFGVNGAKARLLLPGNRTVDVAITNLSEGGAALRCDHAIPTGTEVLLEMADAGDPIPAWVVRSSGNVMAIEFPGDQAVRAQVGRVLEEDAPTGSLQHRAVGARS
jgi:methyl-accepting chemotaxis protein